MGCLCNVSVPLRGANMACFYVNKVVVLKSSEIQYEGSLFGRRLEVICARENEAWEGFYWRKSLSREALWERKFVYLCIQEILVLTKSSVRSSTPSFKPG